MIYVYILSAVVIGLFMPVQAGLNAELTRVLKHPFAGAFVSLTTGAILVFTLVIFRGEGIMSLKRMSDVSPHLLLGGILGALFVGSSLFLIPRLGATAMIGAFITGQLVGSVLIDHYGLLGIQPTPISMTRIFGVLLLFVGVLLVLRKNA